MYGYVLQDWITIRGTTGAGGNTFGGAGDILQGESTWMGLSSFQDIVIWLDVREATLPTSGLTWAFETAPSKDNNLFVSMPTAGAGFNITSLTPGVQLPLGALPRSILASTPGVPLATWLRWRLSPINATAQTWDATFRILVAANRVVRG
jgi:hypothetical protein